MKLVIAGILLVFIAWSSQGVQGASFLDKALSDIKEAPRKVTEGIHKIFHPHDKAKDEDSEITKTDVQENAKKEKDAATVTTVANSDNAAETPVRTTTESTDERENFSAGCLTGYRRVGEQCVKVVNANT